MCGLYVVSAFRRTSRVRSPAKAGHYARRMSAGDALASLGVVGRRGEHASVCGPGSGAVLETLLVDLAGREPRVEAILGIPRPELLERGGGDVEPLRVRVDARQLVERGGCGFARRIALDDRAVGERRRR